MKKFQCLSRQLEQFLQSFQLNENRSGLALCLIFDLYNYQKLY